MSESATADESVIDRLNDLERVLTHIVDKVTTMVAVQRSLTDMTKGRLDEMALKLKDLQMQINALERKR